MIANTFHGLVLGLAQRERKPNRNAPHTVNAPPQTCGLRLRFPTHSHRRPLVCGAIAGNKNLTNPIHAPHSDPGKTSGQIEKDCFSLCMHQLATHALPESLSTSPGGCPLAQIHFAPRRFHLCTAAPDGETAALRKHMTKNTILHKRPFETHRSTQRYAPTCAQNNNQTH